MKNKLLGKTFVVLEAIADSWTPISLKELSLRLRINTSTLSRICSDLTEAGYLRKTNYREFESALGLIYLGQRATLNCYFPKKVNSMIRAHAQATRIKEAIAGVFKDHLVYLYNSDYARSDRAGMPFVNQTHNSNIALTVLGSKFGKHETLSILKESWRRNTGAFPIQAQMRFFSECLDCLRSKGYSFWDGKNHWNVCFPIAWQGDVFGLSLFCDTPGPLGREKLILEASRLAEKIRELLLNRPQN